MSTSNSDSSKGESVRRCRVNSGRARDHNDIDLSLQLSAPLNLALTACPLTKRTLGSHVKGVGVTKLSCLFRGDQSPGFFVSIRLMFNRVIAFGMNNK
jgi:hypothetical protein